jgi:DNA-binding LytR/AlgR family response regulator
MTKLRVLVADDEAPARNKMMRLLQGFENVELVNLSSNGEDALNNITLLKPDIAFLDIEMPGMNGLEVARQIPDDVPTAVVFATAYNDHAIQAFELNAVDYLLKPFGAERIQQALDKVEKMRPASSMRDFYDELSEQMEGNSPFNKIPIPAADRFKLVDYGDVVCIEVEERMTNIFTSDGKMYAVNATLESFEKKLPPDQFIRISRSCIVNLHCIQEIVLWFSNRYKVILTTKKEVISSRERSKALKQLIKF